MMTGAPGDVARDAARTKLLQIFRYLKEFNQLRNPVQREISNQPWGQWFHDLPEHPTIRRGRITVQGRVPQGQVAEGDDFILKVQRPTLSHAPEPPALIAGWLKPAWTSPDGKPEVEPTLSEELPDCSTRVVGFGDDPRRVQAFQRYVLTHASWAETERPARAAMVVFERLYALQARLERESERLELVLGDGLLTWHPSGTDRIHHPILLQNLQLGFNPQIPEFTIRETDQPPELYTALFGDVPEVQAAALARCRQDLEQNGWHPLGDEETNSFFRRTVSQLSPHGIFAPGPGQPPRANAPFMTRDPVLFLRNRSLRVRDKAVWCQGRFCDLAVSR